MAGPESVAWEASVEKARERARRENKAVLVDFTAAPT